MRHVRIHEQVVHSVHEWMCQSTQMRHVRIHEPVVHSVHEWMCQSTQMRHVRIHEQVVHSMCGWSMFWGPHIWLCMSQWIDTFTSSIFIGKAVLKRPLSLTISFLPTQIEGCLFVAVYLCWGISAACPAAAARAVARLPYICTMQTASWMRGRRALLHRYQRWRPRELSFFAITLQSKVHDVQCGPIF